METTEKEHHTYGGSSVDIWFNCPGWASLIKDIPYEEAGKEAKRGTALHTGVLEVKTQAEINHRISGTPIKLDYSKIEGWPEEGPEFATEFWELVWEKVLEKFVTGKTIQIEKKLMLFPELDCGGTADFIVLYYNDKGKLVAVIGDCKFGKVRVDPDKEQLKFYLTALYKIVKEKGKTIDEFKSFVYQPTHHEPYTEHKFTRSEIEKAVVKYEKAIIESKKENPKFKVGDWCKYCKAQGKCLTYNKHLDKEMELMVIRNREQVSLIPPEELTPEVKAKIVLFSDKLVKYFKEVKKSVLLDFLHKTKEETAELRKYVKVIQGRSNRVYTDPIKVADEMQKLNINPYKKPDIKGLGAMEAALIEAGYPKKEAQKIVDSYTHKPEGKPKITSADNPGIDYVFKDAASILEDFDESD